MEYNRIVTIPREIGNLKNLEKLYIQNNNISKNDIPSTLLDNKDIEIHF